MLFLLSGVTVLKASVACNVRMRTLTVMTIPVLTGPCAKTSQELETTLASADLDTLESFVMSVLIHVKSTLASMVLFVKASNRLVV